jgi:hypothetical protein
MLLKLLKYEFKSTGLRFLSAFAVYAVVIGAMLIFARNANPDFQALAIAAIMFCIIGLFIVTFITLFQRYNTNLYGSEGYLMFTLPVGGKMLLLSKLISALVWEVVYCGVFGMTVLLITARYGALPSVNKFFEGVWSLRGELPPYLVAAVAGILFTAMSIYFAITVSKLPVWRGAGVVMGFVAFFVVNVIQSVPSIFFKQISWTTSITFNEHTQVIHHLNDYQQFVGYLWITIAYILVLCVGLFFATSCLMEKRTSLK